MMKVLTGDSTRAHTSGEVRARIPDEDEDHRRPSHTDPGHLQSAIRGSALVPARACVWLGGVNSGFSLAEFLFKETAA